MSTMIRSTELTGGAAVTGSQVEYLGEEQVDHELDAQLIELMTTCFTGPRGMRYRHRRFIHTLPAHRWVMRDQAGRLIAHAAARERSIGTESGELCVGGISEVCVHWAHRRQGHVKRVLAEAHAWMRQRNLAFSMLFGREAIYGSSGYVHIDNPVRRWDSELATWTESPMQQVLVKPLGGRVFPAGVIDLCGPVF